MMNPEEQKKESLFDKITGFCFENWRGFVYMMLSFIFVFILFTCSTSRIKESFDDAAEKTRLETLKCDSIQPTLVQNDVIEQIQGMNYRFTQVLADMRIEFSSQLSGVNLWVALWIAMLAIFGTLTPLIMNYVVRGEAKEEMKKAKEDMRKIKEETIREQNKLEYIGTNIRLLNILNSIDSFIYENCSTFGSARPHATFAVYLLSLVESLRKYYKIIEQLGENDKLQMATLLSVVSGIRHILRQVPVVFTNGIFLTKALARVNDLDDLLDINLKTLLEKDREYEGKAVEEMKVIILETINGCIASIDTLKVLLEHDRRSIEPI